jgi:two-component system, cell cycle sensor histidine kinase and response regulator CckA
LRGLISKGMHELLFEMSGDGILLHECTTTSTRGHFMAANDAICRLLGYTALEMSQLTPFDVMSPEETPRIPEEAEAMRRNGTLIHEKHLVAKDGRLVPVELSSRLFEEEGRTLALSVVRDISARKRAEEARSESERRLRLHVQSTPVAVVEYDRQFRVTAWNPAAEAIFGWSAEEALERHANFIVPESARLHVEAVFRQLLDRKAGQTSVNENVTKDGGLITCAWNNTELVSSSGETIGVASMALDVTLHKRAEALLLEKVALLDLAHDAIIVRDVRDQITFWNKGAEDTYGWAQEEAIGRVASELLKTRLPLPLTELDGHLAENGRWEGELVHTRRDDREIAVASRWVVQRDTSGRQVGILEINRDVTEQRRAEEQFRQAQKLESIGRLAGGVAHDFNNLLTVISSCADSLGDDVASGVPAKLEEIEEIRAAGRRAAELTRQLLTFARRQVIAPVPLDLNAVVRGSEKLLRRVLGEDIELVTRLEPDVWTVRCDPGQLEQVILNLAVNARDAMPNGGKLTIDTTNAQVDERLVALHPFMRAGPYVGLTIGDSGTGMTREAKSHAFEPFFTTKPPGKGTGLGLATVFGIVKQSEGYILVESEPGRGTTFVVYLPRTLEVAVPAPSASTTKGRGTETVLVVEDDAHVCAVTVRSLRAGGYRVLVAHGGHEALAIAEREGPLHLLVTDVIMPGISGTDVAAALRRRQADLRVLYVSGYMDEVLTQNGVLDPETELLLKPFSGALLQERVRKILDAR